MKKVFIPAILLVAASSWVMGQEATAPPASTPTPRAEGDKIRLTNLVHALVNKHGSPEDMLRELDADCTTASVQGNVDALTFIEADGFTFTGPDGSIMTKTQDLQTIQSGDLVYESIALDDVSVRVFKDSGVVTGRANVKGKYKNFDISGYYRYTVMFVMLGGRWQAVASQMTRVQS